MTPELYERIQEIVLERANGAKPDLSELQARIGTTSYGSAQQDAPPTNVAVIALHGVLISRAGMLDTISGATSPQVFAQTVRDAANNPKITHIVLDVDSGGGTVSGTAQAAEAVDYATGKKPVIACVNDMSCSAAYWITSQATEVVIPPQATLGSIGVIATHLDRSKQYAQAGIKPTIIRSADLKALGQDSEPMTGKALQQITSRVESLHEQFVGAVASGRGVSTDVAAKWGTGETWLGQDAVKMGLADRLGTLDSVLEELNAEDEEEQNDIPPLTMPEAASTTSEPSPSVSEPSTSSDSASDAVLNQPAPAGAAPSPEAFTQEDKMSNITDITAKVAAGQPLTAEERTALTAHLDGQSTASTTPDMSQWPAEARAAVEAAQRQADQAADTARKAQATADTERNTRLDREFREKALALGQPVEFGATLRKLHEADPEAATATENALKAAHAQSDITRTLGASAPQKGLDPAARIEARAKELEAQGAKADAALEQAMRELSSEANDYSKEVRA